jgi:hypothetical protein
VYSVDMSADKPVKISISGRLTFEDQITLGQAAQIVAFLDAPTDGTSPAGLGATRPTRPGGSGGGGGTLSPRDALESSGAKTNPEKLVAFGLAVLQEGTKDTFTVEDVKPLFRRARETTPKNMPRDIDAAIKAGWITESEAKGEFYVTEKAAGVLEAGFESLRGSRTARGNGAKPRSSTPKKPRKSADAVPEAFSAIDEIPVVIDGLVDYHKLTTRKDRFLWAVNVAKSLGVAAVSNQQVVWLTDQLGDGIETKQITANFTLNQKPGYVNRSTQNGKIRITPQGQEYLKLLAGA